MYDSAKKIDGLPQTVEVDRIQSDGRQFQVIALFAIQNESKPPRTLEDEHTFTFVLPEGATIESGLSRGPGGQPINDQPTATGAKNQYAFSFPLKPGETQFQLSYHLPYNGKASFSPKPLAEVQHFVVMTPQGMTFTPKDPKRFQSMPDKSGAGIMVATETKPGEDLSFTIAGTGQFQPEGQQAEAGGQAADGGGEAMGGGQAAARDSRPGGGLGAPIDSNDPLYDYRAVILGIFALVLVMGGFYVIGKSNSTTPALATPGAAVRIPVNDAPAPTDRSSKLLDAMKDELFHLELDRQQGKISADEYAKAKAALDETIKRALARQSS